NKYNGSWRAVLFRLTSAMLDVCRCAESGQFSIARPAIDGPELEDNDLASQIRPGKRLGVEPFSVGQRRCRRADDFTHFSLPCGVRVVPHSCAVDDRLPLLGAELHLVLVD